MRIKKATTKDVTDLAEIFRVETAKKPYEQKWNTKTARDKIKDFLKNQDVFVAIIGEEIIGFISCEKSSNNKSVYVEELWLKSKNQRHGVGRELMRYIEDLYRKQNVTKVCLVTDKRSGAFKFYNKLKYKPHSENIFLEKRLK